jgi:2,3-bisphosphoglycerate-independent phosphoglycerate mutase
MREIVTVMAQLDKPVELEIPKDLVRTRTLRLHRSRSHPAARRDDVALQPGVDAPGRVPAAGDDERARRVARAEGRQAGAHRGYARLCRAIARLTALPETEKYAHVTFFFNGGVEKQFDHEERHLVPSPKVPTYDKQPEMSVQAVADKVAEVVRAGTNEFVMCNFAPPDMVGHTGMYDAAVKAISATDAAVGTVYKACQDAGYVLLITADHGNAEQMVNPQTGDPHTAHTTNKVPLIMTGDPKVLRFKEDEKKDGEEDEEGALCDVAPTVLDLLGLPKPEGARVPRLSVFIAHFSSRDDRQEPAREERDVTVRNARNGMVYSLYSAVQYLLALAGVERIDAVHDRVQCPATMPRPRCI